MENKVLGPMILQEYEKGRGEGRQAMLAEQLTEKFAALPTWASARLQVATTEELHAWVKRVLRADTLEDTLR